MSEKKVSINKIVSSQLPSYVNEEFPLIGEFLKQYYLGQEYQGAPIDLIENIDNYIKLDNLTNLVGFTTLTADVDEFTDTISVSDTRGFSNKYGLIKIDDEIITYTGITSTTFNGCIRGFSGITSFRNPNDPQNLVFSTSQIAFHSKDVTQNNSRKVENLSNLFLNEFLKKIKYQILPGFEDVQFNKKLNQSLLLKQSKNFYSSKGTDASFKILFKSLYDEDVKVVKPRENIFRPSDANYRVTNDIVVESLEGDPSQLTNSTLYQGSYGNILPSQAPVTKVEKISSGISTRTYYKLSLNSPYDKTNQDIYNNFSIHPKTKLIGDVSTGATIFNVDSTVGFPNKGTLNITYTNGSIGIVTYSHKNITQFLGINSNNLSSSISDSAEINLDTYAYGSQIGSGVTDSIKVRVRPVLRDFNIPEKTRFYAPGDPITIKTLGLTSNEYVFNNWLFNTSQSYDVESLSLIDNVNLTYRIITKDKNILRIKDSISVKNSSGSLVQASVIEILSDKSFLVTSQGFIGSSSYYVVKRNLLKTTSSEYPNLSGLCANVQNVYKDKDGDKNIVASLSLPFYGIENLDQPKQEYQYIINGFFLGGTDTFEILSHNLYTGDAVYYTPEKNGESVVSSLFSEGSYFVKVVDPNHIKLSRSLSNIFNSIFVSVSSDSIVNNNKIQLLKFKDKSISPQNLLREISTPKSEGKINPTKSGLTGILVNGTEILNYKSSDYVYYGGIENIEVLSPGEDYDVINPPILSIQDSIGAGATGYCAVKGSFKDIKIIDPGFDFLETPSLKITGGNGRNAKAEINLKNIPYEINFNSGSNSFVGIGSTLSTIKFSNSHKLRNGEKIIYKTSGGLAISGLSTNAVYYVAIKDATTIKLHKNFDEATVGINTIVLSNYGSGTHAIKSFNGKSILGSVKIINSGIDYENKKRTCSNSGVSTSLNLININNHDYKSGEIINYSFEGNPILGISTSMEYYITSIDKNNFKLSEVAIGSTNKDFYFKTKQYIDFKISGIGTHIFNYPQISVEIISKSGISSISSDTFSGALQPIVHGNITSIHLKNNGVGYGSSDILNYRREPSINLYSGVDAKLFPIISNGKIIAVTIASPGTLYNSSPQLKINGKGNGCSLFAIVEDGRIISVVVSQSGIGYNQSDTTIEVIANGKGAILSSKIKSWRVNLFKKYFKKINIDDGVITNSINSDYGLQYCHLYAPRELRKILYASSQSGQILYGKKDLRILNGIEINSTDHSPIIGWAYDGNPIYGPYGYSKKSGGNITQLKSGYSSNFNINNPNRPPNNEFPEEFFIEDFSYFNSDDESVLDENNGRFCITPEFPNGTYAYFATFDLNIESSGVFNNYKKPAFPYLVGENYKSQPIEFNFKKYSNQESIDLNKVGWLRNTYPYSLKDKNSYYSYLTSPNDLNPQTSFVKFASKGSIESIGIFTGGSNYQVNDKLIFNNDDTGGTSASAKVSKVNGKLINSISVFSNKVKNVEFYPSNSFGVFIGFATSPHSFNNKDIVTVSGLNTSSSFLYGSYDIGINTDKYILNTGIDSTTNTGIVTYFYVNGDFNYPKIRENDIFKIDSEQIKVLNIDPKSSRIRVLREINGTVGTLHTAPVVLTELSRKFEINVGYKTAYDYKINKEIYFDPSESLGIGTISGVGIGYTLSFSNPGVGLTEIFIPTKTIYLPDHKLETGDEVIYSFNGGSSIGVSTDGAVVPGIGNTYFTLNNKTSLYVAKISKDLIGISTVKVGIGSTGNFVGIASTTSSIGTLYLINPGSNVFHSLKTNYPLVVKGTLSKNLVTVSLASTHGLLTNDDVYMEAIPNNQKTIVVKYNDYNRRLLINPRSFTSVGVNTNTDEINLVSHGFVNGQKVLHTSNSPCGGLENNKIYYTLIIDEDNIKLTNIFNETLKSSPNIVGISSTSFGTISPINPPIEVYKNSSVVFDLSDSSLSYQQSNTSYPAFKFDLYSDSKFIQEYNSNNKSPQFSTIQSGTIGVTADAKITLSINENTPKILYYKLTPINSLENPIEKSQIVIDDSVDSFNQIILKNSQYSGKYKILVGSSTSFLYNLSSYPESSSYDALVSNLSYKTDSKTSFGSIAEISILNGGLVYNSLPGISSIQTQFGTGFILDTDSEKIGIAKTVRLDNIGFDYPSDFTVRPIAKLPEVAIISPLTTFDYIGITSFGIGYTVAPKLIVIDGKTKRTIDDVSLKFILGKDKVEIIQNTFSLNDTIPTIIPIQNTNGVGIANINYNQTTKDVSITLNVGFSTITDFPFKINDRVLIENISVGVGSTGKGYNSSSYSYNLFTIKSIHPNIGGIGIVTYNLGDYLKSGEIPGNFSSINSAGRIIPEKQFPIFNSVISRGKFLLGEKVTDGISEGIVANWDTKTKYLKIITSSNFREGLVIEGKTSGSKGKIAKIIKSDSDYKVDSYSIVRNGWEYETGFLSDNLQRLQDNDYYQNFAYSLKSKVPYDTWNNVVSNLNHTLGFRKFGDLQIESTFSQKLTPSVGFSTLSSNINLVSTIDLNCVNYFDLVSENSLGQSPSKFSNEITFNSRVLLDYLESIGNRVLVIDDISNQFNSSPGSNKFAEIDRFNLNEHKFEKYITYVRDRRYETKRQLSISTLLHDNFNRAYINQYAKITSQEDLGSFDFSVQGNEGIFRFYPNNYLVNNYDVASLSYNLKDTFTNIAISNFDGNNNLVSVATSSVIVSSAATTIVGIASTSTSAKILVSIHYPQEDKYEFNELNLVQNGSQVSILEYGQLTNYSYNNLITSSGLGTYYSYISSNQVKVDFIPKVGLSTMTVNTLTVSFGNSSSSGIGTYDIKNVRLEASTTSIASTSSPQATKIASYPDAYDGSYFLIQASNINTGESQFSEVVLVDDDSEVYYTEYANVETLSGLGTIGANRNSSITELTFTPIQNVDIQVKVFMNALRYENVENDIISFNDGALQSNYGIYYGTAFSPKKDFNLTSKNYPIFKRAFDASNTNIVDIVADTITIQNHFFVTGEELTYSPYLNNFNNSVGIATTSIVGVGTTNKLPSSVYVVKIDSNKIKLADSAENALKVIPQILNIVNVGIGTSHNFITKNQNKKVILTIDNMIQSPIVSTAITSSLKQSTLTTDEIIYFAGITSFFSGDLIKIDEEIMRINGVGIGSTNAIRVSREILGSVAIAHTSNTKITKIVGNYNIVENVLNFVDSPQGNTPIGSTTNSPDSRDWIGISSSSSFHGRVFLRSGEPDSVNETYYKNKIYDDISSEFNGYNKTFTLKSNSSNVAGFSTENAIILINNIFQGPNITNDYILTENIGVTSITFTGAASSVSYDPNNASVPIGGIIISAGSTPGFGYQPLVSAGGTAVVSIAGTISSISIGNSGSGYRAGSQIIRVGVALSSTGTPNIEFIGTASVSNGHIVSIAITNPGIGYTRTNPPYVIIDRPLSYSNIPLIYSASSGGNGAQAKINVVVGQGSSIIDFEIINTGYGYGQGELLTIPIGGSTGIPTTSSFNFKEFNISVDTISSSKFNAWSIGDLLVLDNFSNLFNGSRVTFPIQLDGNPISIQAAPGSNISIQDTLLIFINDILQIPGISYKFNGGSSISFTEPPREGDRLKFIFYRGTENIDVVLKDILETVKVGDTLTIGYDPDLNQTFYDQEDERTVTNLFSSNVVNTNLYFGDGKTENTTLLRPVTWCRQTEDKIIDNIIVSKSRLLYEPIINPSSYLIQSVGIGSTIAFVDNIRPFFNPINENQISTVFQRDIEFISQETKISSAATSIVSVAGTISSIVISDGGAGYISSPEIAISFPIGLGTTARSFAQSTISVGGTVSNILVTTPGIGYTSSNPPTVLISHPSFQIEKNKIPANGYEGDFGIITGISTSSVGIASTGIVFDFLIPEDSFLRNSLITQYTSQSGIKTGYYFVVYNSNVGQGVTSLGSDGSVIGIGASFLDNIYQVAAVSIAQTSTPGLGVTFVAKVTVSVSSYNGLTGIGYSNFYGEFSWGRISLGGRKNNYNHPAYTTNGSVGISTGTILRRVSPLKYLNYSS